MSVRPEGAAGGADRGGIVTLLFTDLVSSTEWLELLGDDGAEAQRRVHFALLRDALEATGGTEVKNLGDGLMVVFHSAVRAVECAVGMQQGVARHNQQSSTTLGVRIGLHVGEPIRDESDYFGTPVVVAKRLCDLAQGGQILVSGLVAALARGRTSEFVDVGPLMLKGLADPVEAFEVAWVSDEPASTASEVPAALRETDRTFVGREADVDRLAQMWKQAATGAHTAVFVGGEPGVGKTRLASELARTVVDQGGRVLYGRCDEDLGAAYQPFIEALAPYVATRPAADIARTVGTGIEQLARLFPSLASTGERPSRETEPEAERYLLFEAITRFLAAESSSAPLLFIIDDLHWAAKPTLLLLRHVIRAPVPMPLLVLGTYRDTEVGKRHALGELLADMRRDPTVQRVSLQGIDPSSVRLLLESLDDAPADGAGEGIADAVHAATLGNPFYVREIVTYLQEHDAGGGRAPWTSAFGAGGIPLPDGVRDVIGRRIGRLSESAQSVLAVASVIGATFDVDVVEGAGDTEPGDVVDALEEATGAGLIVETAPGYAFTHDLTRETLYSELGNARRVRVHRRVGETVERVRGDRAPVEALAHHFLAGASAGTTDKAVAYSVDAAARAMEQLAFERAVGLLTRALDAVGTLDVTPAQRADLLLALAAAHAGASEFDDSRRVSLLAADAARAASSAERLAEAAVLYNEWGNLALGVPDPRAEPLCREALDGLGDEDSALRARLLSHLALYRFWSDGEGDGARQLATEALGVADRLGDAETRSLALHAVATSLDGSDRVEERLAVVRQQRDLPNRGIFVTDSLYGEGIAMIELAERAGLEAVISELEGLPSAERGWWRPRCWATVFKAMLALMEGRLDEVEPLASQMLEMWDSPDGMNTYGAQLLMLRREQGRLEELLPMVEDVAKAPAFRPVLAWAYAELGDVENARRVLHLVAEDSFASLSRGAMWGGSLCWLAAAAIATGESEAASVLYELLAPHAGHLILTGHGGCCIGAADSFLGTLAGLLGDDRAEAHLRAGLELEDRMGACALATRTRLHLGKLLVAGGDADAARPWLEAAAADAARLAMPVVEHRARDLLQA